MDFNNPKEFNDPLVSHDPKGISIGIMGLIIQKSTVIPLSSMVFMSGGNHTRLDSDTLQTCGSVLLQSSARSPMKRCSQCNRACFEVLGGVCTIFSIHKSPYSYLLSISYESFGL